MRGLLAVIVKELLQIRRDRRALPLILVAPMIQLIVFGYAANTEVNQIPTLLVDQDRTAESRALVDRFLASGYFDLAGSVDQVDQVEPWLVSGKAQIALVIGAGYGREAAAGRAPDVQVIADGSDATSAGAGLSYVAMVISQAAGDLVARQAGAAAAGLRPAGTITLTPRVWYNPNLRARWFYVPAVLALVLMLITMLVSAMAVVREKEIGTLEQIIVTPIRPWQLIAGKLLPFMAIGLFDLLLVTAVAVLYFGLPLRGSPILLVGLSIPFILCTLGLGLLMSTLVRNQQQAMIGSIFMLMVPMLYLSGLIFPIENMPRVIQAVTYIIPLRYYAVIIRGIFLKGSGIGVLWPQGALLLAMGVTVLGLASLRFRKTLD